MEPIFADIEDEIRYFSHAQAGKYSHIYSATFLTRVGTVANQYMQDTAILLIENDADFHVTHIAGSVVGPAGSSNRREVAQDVEFLAAGVSLGRSDRGIGFKIREGSTGRNLTQAFRLGGDANIANGNLTYAKDDFIPFENVFAPGYGFELRAPVPFKYDLKRGERLILTVQQRDNNQADPEVAVIHRVSFAFLGTRYA